MSLELVKHKKSRQFVAAAPEHRSTVIQNSKTLSFASKASSDKQMLVFMGSVAGACVTLPAAIASFVAGDIVLGSVATTALMASLKSWQTTFIIGGLSGGTMRRSDRSDGTIARNAVARAVKKADRKYGWRPRQDVSHPKGRDDTYPRQLVKVIPLDDGRYRIDLQSWHHGTPRWGRPEKTWQCSNTPAKTHVAADDGEMTTIHAEFTSEAAVYNENQKTAWLAQQNNSPSSKTELTVQSMISVQLNNDSSNVL